jgi:dipeptidyl-peptidase 4
MTPKRRWRGALALLAALGLLPGRGVQSGPAGPALEKLTPERLAADPPLAGGLPTELRWHPDGKRLTYLSRGGEAELLALDAVTGRTSTVVPRGSLTLPDAADGATLTLGGYAWFPDGARLLVPHGGDLFVVDVAAGRVRALVRTPEEEEFAEPSPDGRRVAFVRRNDLFVVDVASGREVALTRSGSETVLNGRLDWVYEEELASRSGRAYVWAPDSRSIAYLQLDQARVPTFPLVDFRPVENEVFLQRYPKAGKPNAVVRVGVVGLGDDLAPGPERLLSFEPDDMYVVPDLAFTPDGRTLAFQWLNRAQDELQLRFLPVPESRTAPLGAPRTVLTERGRTWVNALTPPLFLKDGRRFLWLSERSGFAHVYLCDDGGGCRAVTEGPWMVDGRVSFTRNQGAWKLDERAGFVYLVATEKDPRERHLYRVRLDGTGRTQLTREAGTHRVLLSPDGRFYADTFSDAATPPRLWVQGTDGPRRHVVEANAAAPIAGYERGTLEWVSLRARDGTPLHASLLKPAGFDPSRRYPVVVFVYGGPHAQVVTNAWEGSLPFKHLLASHGFLVWSLDNRGSSGRGYAFEAAVHRELGRTELEDQLVGVDHLRSLPYVDPARIGIHGWSYGGYLTLYALTRAPGVFRAGVAGAPVTDWRFYDTIYTERYMGTPEDNPKGYEASAPLTRAQDLRAALLLIHGTADDNVHLANTMAFVEALVRAGRPYVLLTHPGQRHGFAGKADRAARDTAILRHFETYLKDRPCDPAHRP